MNRVGEDVVHRTLLDDLARIHNGNRVRNLSDEREVVAHEDHCEAEFFLQALQQVNDLLLNRNVKSV